LILAAAALLAGDPVDELIERLGNDDPFERDRATEALKRLGRRAEAPLKALRTDDAEVAWRREEILEHIASLHESPVLLSIVQVGDASARVLHVDEDRLPGSGFAIVGVGEEASGSGPSAAANAARRSTRGTASSGSGCATDGRPRFACSAT